MFLPLELLLEYWIEHVSIERLTVKVVFLNWESYGGVPGLVTYFPCDVWCRGLITCLLVFFHCFCFCLYIYVYIYIYIIISYINTLFFIYIISMSQIMFIFVKHPCIIFFLVFSNRCLWIKIKNVRGIFGLPHFDGSRQGCSISIAYALEILQSCTKPLISVLQASHGVASQPHRKHIWQIKWNYQNNICSSHSFKLVSCMRS